MGLLSGRIIPLGTRFTKRLTVHYKPRGFRDIGGVIANAFDVFSDKQQVRARGDHARIFGHVGQHFAK